MVITVRVPGGMRIIADKLTESIVVLNEQTRQQVGLPFMWWESFLDLIDRMDGKIKRQSSRIVVPGDGPRAV